MKSALMVVGAAAGVAAAASWLGKKRHLKAVAAPRQGVDTRHEELSPPRESYFSFRESMVEPESVELPLGRSADPAIDGSLSHGLSRDETSGGSLLAEHEHEPAPRSADIDLALDDIWSSTPGIAEPEQSEGYDAVLPEDLGTVWIQRATQTTHDERPHASDSNEVPQLEDLISQASLTSAAGALEDEDEDDEIAEDDLDEGDERSDQNRDR
jgi:hypothetical protein